MTLWGAIAGGFVGTIVMAVLLEAAAEARLTRLDLAYLLGTLVSKRRVQARAAGYALVFAVNLGLAVAYWAALDALGWAGWGAGAALGAVHGAVTAAVLLPVALPVVHPRLPLTSPADGSAIEPPGLLSANYGRLTPLVILVTHASYGTIVGGFASLPA